MRKRWKITMLFCATEEKAREIRQTLYAQGVNTPKFSVYVSLDEIEDKFGL